MKSFIIKKNDENQRLDSFMHKAVPRLPQGLMHKYIRLKRIKINKAKTAINYRIKQGDLLELYINDEFFVFDEVRDFLNASDKIDIVFEDSNIILCDKPSGLCVHADNDNSPDTLINRALRYLYNKGEYNPDEEVSFTPALCNRIDRNTAGIVIIAKTAEALRVMNEKIKNREIQKYYLCVVHGTPKPLNGVLTHYIERRENDSHVITYDAPHKNAKTAVLIYKTLKSSKENSLLEIELKTGRTHQIRAQMAHIGHPLIGDGKYGNGAYNRAFGVSRQLLYSYKLRFSFNDTDNELGYLDKREFSVKNIWFNNEFEEKF